jgi:hypothetical protein
MPLIMYSPALMSGLAVKNGVDDSTVLMLHADDYIDSSNSQHPITTTVAIDSSVKRTGTSSFHFNNDTFLIPNSTDFQFGTGDFTIDFWMKTSSTSQQYLCGGHIDYEWCIATWEGNTHALAVYINGLGWPVMHGTAIVNDNNWHHIALVRYGTILTLYVDGITDVTITIPSTYNWSTTDFNIGGQQVQKYHGWLDEFRVSKGIARWIAPFTPRTTPYELPGNGVDSDNILLLHLENYTDSSSYNHTVNSNGTTLLNYPYGKFVWGIDFGDTAGYLSIPTSTDFDFGVSDWTVDFWANFLTVNNVINSLFCTGNGTKGIYLRYTGSISVGNFELLLSNGITLVSHLIPYNIVATNWYHIAVVRQVRSYKLFVNGMLVGTVSPSFRVVEGAYPFIIGSEYSNTTAYRMRGYMDEFRVSKGVARFGENFVPATIPYGGMPILPIPTATFADITNATLNTTFVQSSAINNLYIPTSISISGNSAVYSLDGITYTASTGVINPGATVWLRIISSGSSLSTVSTILTVGITSWSWNVTTKYTTINTNLLLLVNNGPSSSNINNGSFVDLSNNHYTINKVGTTTPSTFSPFGSDISAYFDGSEGSYLSIPNTSINLFNTNYTIESWVYEEAPLTTVTNTSSIQPTLYVGENTTNNNLTCKLGGFEDLNTGVVLAHNTWNHVALVGSSTQFTIYINGVASYTSIHSPTDTNLNFFIGAVNNITGSVAPLKGYITGTRIVNGTQVYTSNFTPPTSAPANITNTGLLVSYNLTSTNFADRSVYSANVMITGTPTADTPLFSYNSMNFTTGGSLTYSNSLYAVGTGDFTVDFWVYRNGTFPTSGLVSSGLGATDGFMIICGGDTLDYGLGNSSPTYTTSTIIPLNTWTHIAYVRRNGITLAYKNGILLQVLTIARNLNSTILSIGARYGGGAYPITNAIMSNVRLMNFAVWGGYIVPTSLATDINTTLLLKGNGTSLVAGTLVDSTSRHTVTNTNTQLTSSIFFNGYNSYIFMSDSPDWYIGGGDATIEGWINWDGQFSSNQKIWGQNPSTLSNMGLSITGVSGQLTAYINSDTTLFTSSINLIPNQWNHVAYQKAGTTFTLYVNGQVGGQITNSTALSDLTANWYFGSDDGLGGYFSGMMKELRITNGIPRYANTLSNVPYTSDANTVYLLHGEDLLDSSSFNRSFTTYSGSQQISNVHQIGTQSIQSIGGWFTDASVGSINLYLQSDFTLECWVRWIPSVTSLSLFSVNNAYQLYWYPDGRIILDYYGVRLQYSLNPVANTWYHIAAVKSGSTGTLYLNGIAQSSSTLPTSGYTVPGTSMFMGIDAVNHGFGGACYFDEIRISNIARWTANFIPAYAVTSIYTTFTPPTTYTTDAYTMALIHGNTGTDATIYDDVGNNVTDTGGVNISTTISKYDNNSLYFNGLGGYIKTDSLQSYVLGSSDFTIEFWLYVNSSVNNIQIVSNIIGSTYTTNDWKFTFGTNHIQFIAYNATGQILQSLNTIANNTWYHIAVVREGSLFTLFVNGVVSSTFTHIGSIDSNTTSIIKVGGMVASNALDGYIDDLRVSNIARYHTNFNLPTIDYD